MYPKVAIVTTLINAGPVLEYFINYHLRIGFNHLFLFFDDPNDSAIRIARQYDAVTVICKDEKLLRRWRKTRLYQRNSAYHKFVHTEVMARQLLNVEIAVQMALKKNISWLLHIDVDELFYSPHMSVQEHFLSLSGKRSVTYLNHEAVPEAIEIQNYFSEVSLFKKNTSVLDLSQIAFINKQVAFNFGAKYFLYYSAGKSAAQVNENLFPVSVHAFYDDFEHISTDPVILHYPVCGFKHFWDKYRTLGDFSDKWFDEISIGNNVPFHLQARNEIYKNDQQSALSFYRKYIMLDNEEFIAECISKKLFFRRKESYAGEVKDY
ncbi:glycosyltransferase family 2 protein [Fulvivirgaceae bacterium BMA12]|uniref:Glycosyltransferase family 2 protein n=1 Tax=Agaribacillus aureus TaxID=3051825 RepID=A0ABT8LIB6_9BACT|nr:glycosyltransferase family 2 protein [Fulvivirgaceae bacterium BMA12]